jgi:hypothetical protein
LGELYADVEGQVKLNTLEDLQARLMQDPEYARAARHVRRWWWLTSRVETLRFRLAYWLTRFAMWIDDYGEEIASAEWWEAYRKQHDIPERDE